jgi:8-amino-7-oxononanoate synthase
MSLVDRWNANLTEIRRRGQHRVLSLSSGVDLCSNDYLGYSARPRRTADEQNELLRRRSATAARLLRGHDPIWEEVEATLAVWHGAGACLMMNSGYAANEGLLSTIVQRTDWVASDESNHASIIDGLRLSRAERFVFRHADLSHLEDGLRRAATNRAVNRELFIVTESLFGMDGDIAPLTGIVNLAERYGAHLIVDEAHSTGCFGDNGSGLVDSLALRRRVAATVHTGGKALAVAGAYICGSILLRELLINRCRHFMFSTALPPAVGLWWSEAIDRVKPDTAARAALRQAARVFREELTKLGVRPSGSEYIMPIVVGADDRCECVARQIRARGWDIRAIRSPTVPAGTARLRISIHADHAAPILAEVAAAVAEVLEANR